MPTFNGRVEARIAVPAGGASISASIGASASATTVTVPAGNYFLTAAGGVPSLCTTLQDGLNQNVQGYPQTAAACQTALSYGTWTGGSAWLCNEASGNLAPVFGAVTLTAATPPGYGTAGPRAGIDKAITLDTTDLLTGGVTFTVGATDDLIVIWVARSSSTTAFDNLVGQGTAGEAAYWTVYKQSNLMRFRVTNAGVPVDIDATYTAAANEWYVGIAAIDRATGKARVGVQAITSGTQGVSPLTTIGAVSFTSATNFRVGYSSGFGSNAGTVDLAYLAVVTGSGVAAGLPANMAAALTSLASAINDPWYVSLGTDGRITVGGTRWTRGITWTTTNLRDLLGFAADLSASTSYTSTQQAHGVWYPNCPLSIEGDPAQAPRVTDTRRSMSPQGLVLSLSGNYLMRHRGVTYTHVPRAQVWESAATYTNASWETFCKDAMYGMGHAWFTPGSAIQVWWDDAGTTRNVGYTWNGNVGVPAWYVVDVTSTEPKPAIQGWTGLWRIELGTIVAEGG